MKVVYEKQFRTALEGIVDFIAEDKASASLKSKRELKRKFEVLCDNPKMYRESVYFDDENYRDMTFRGYTIIYKIVSDKELRVLDVFKWIDKK